MNYKKWMVSLVVVLLGPPVILIPEPLLLETMPFRLVDEKEGIKAFERWHTSLSGSPYGELKAVYVMATVSSPILRFVLDPIVRSNLLKIMAAFRQAVGSL